MPFTWESSEAAQLLFDGLKYLRKSYLPSPQYSGERGDCSIVCGLFDLRISPQPFKGSPIQFVWPGRCTTASSELPNGGESLKPFDRAFSHRVNPANTALTGGEGTSTRYS